MSFPDDLPRYRSHKVVRAVKICSVIRDESGVGGRIIPAGEDDLAPFPVTEGYLRQHAPQSGGYFILYDDGYQSYSPAPAFEEGYTRL